MKSIAFPLVSLFLALIPPAQAKETKAVSISIEVPDPGWSVHITGLYKKGGDLLVISQAKHNGNAAAMVISQAKSTVMTDAVHAELPKKHYLLGRTWNWGEGYTAISEKERDLLIKDAEPIDFASKGEKPKQKDFIGLPLKEAQELADKHSLLHRVVMVDGVPRPATQDYRPERLNFAVIKGVVTEVSKG